VTVTTQKGTQYVMFVGLLACVLPLVAHGQEQAKDPVPTQAPSGNTQAEPKPEDAPKPPTLDVKPGSPAVKATEEHEPLSPIRRLPKHIWQDQVHIWTSPFHTSRQDVKWWAIFGGATVAFVATDRWTSKQLPNTQSQITAGNWASRLGAIYTIVPIDAAMYVIGTTKHNDRLRETGLIGEEALIDSFIVDNILKTAFDRQRPTEGNGNGAFWQGNGRFWNSGSSFPSGHAIHTWSLASVIAHEYPHPIIIPILVYTYAMGVNIARFAARQHFASDIVAGSAMGWFIGDFVYAKRHNEGLDAPQRSAMQRLLAHVHFGGME